MTTEQFTYWLQGFAEIQSQAPTEEQWTIIKDHLALVFDKKTPDRNFINNPPKGKGETLDDNSYRFRLQDV
jgi:hypothetical protein